MYHKNRGKEENVTFKPTDNIDILKFLKENALILEKNKRNKTHTFDNVLSNHLGCHFRLGCPSGVAGCNHCLKKGIKNEIRDSVFTHITINNSTGVIARGNMKFRNNLSIVFAPHITDDESFNKELIKYL